MTREEVVQAALVVERWCADTDCEDCPFTVGCNCFFGATHAPDGWNLEEFLRTRGMRDGKG